jgi:hypothetical protein
MRAAFRRIDKMAEIQRSRRLSGRPCGRRPNGFVQNGQERRSPNRANFWPRFLAAWRFFCHSLHAVILARRLESLAEPLLPSTRIRNLCPRSGNELDVIEEGPANIRGVTLPRRGSANRENHESRSGLRQWAIVASKAERMTPVLNKSINYNVNTNVGESLCSGDNSRFSIFSLTHLRICNDVWERKTLPSQS